MPSAASPTSGTSIPVTRLIAAGPSSTAPSGTPAPSAAPTAVPTPQSTATLLTLSGTVYQSGKPVRSAINIYRATADFCSRVWPAAGGPGGLEVPERLRILNNVFDGAYAMRGIPPGTYHVVVSLRVAPGGNWFWNQTSDCAKAEAVTLIEDTARDFTFP